jgi:hypothetical protein
MLTTHRRSFPTCLFHPRSIHLLCHLDSPSAANLPCLGLQQQTGPEVSELCGSYRVPSRSSLLPLRTLSPGENRSQANKPQSPLSVQYCCGHNNPWGKQTQAFPNWFNNHRMVSRSQLRDRDSTHRLALSDKGCIGFPNLTQALPESTLRLLVQRVYGVYSYRGQVGRTVQQIGSNEGETPITARFNSFHCHYNIVPRLWVRDCVTSNSRRGRHRLHGSEQRCTGSSEQTQAFPPFQNCTRVSCRGHTVHAQDSPGSNGGGTPQHGSSQPFIACARVDTCHPCDCMRSFSMRSSHHLENHMSFQKDLG